MTILISNASPGTGYPAISPRTRLRLAVAGVWCAVTIASILIAASACQGVVASGNAMATAHHLIASGTLYRMGFAIDVIALACLL
jgi:hypothetical protein